MKNATRILVLLLVLAAAATNARASWHYRWFTPALHRVCNFELLTGAGVGVRPTFPPTFDVSVPCKTNDQLDGRFVLMR